MAEIKTGEYNKNMSNTARKLRSLNYVVVIDGTQMWVPTKKQAHGLGHAARAAGHVAFAYSRAFYEQFITRKAN